MPLLPGKVAKTKWAAAPLVFCPRPVESVMKERLEVQDLSFLVRLIEVCIGGFQGFPSLNFSRRPPAAANNTFRGPETLFLFSPKMTNGSSYDSLMLIRQAMPCICFVLHGSCLAFRLRTQRTLNRPYAVSNIGREDILHFQRNYRTNFK
jgi:hypothetical protein